MEFGFTRERASMGSQYSVVSLGETEVKPRPDACCGAKLIPWIGAQQLRHWPESCQDSRYN